MTRFITQAVFSGTKINLAIAGKDVNSCYQKAVKKRELREASVFVFYSRKTGKMVDIRFN